VHCDGARYAVHRGAHVPEPEAHCAEGPARRLRALPDDAAAHRGGSILHYISNQTNAVCAMTQAGVSKACRVPMRFCHPIYLGSFRTALGKLIESVCVRWYRQGASNPSIESAVNTMQNGAHTSHGLFSIDLIIWCCSPEPVLAKFLASAHVSMTTQDTITHSPKCDMCLRLFVADKTAQSSTAGVRFGSSRRSR
jgi:hypothetical protein